MGKLIGFLASVAILAGSVYLAYYLVSLAPEPERREPPPQIPFVQSARVVAGSGAIPVYSAGTVRPSAEIDIAPLVTGRVTWLDRGFQSGGHVKSGQTILRIEEADYLNRVRQAEADLEARKVALYIAQEEASFARTEFEEYSRQQTEAGSSVGEPGPLALKEPQLKAAQAELNRVEVQIAAAKLALSRTEVRAPFDGYVRGESVDVGQYVTAGQTVGRLFASDAVEVVVPVSDASAALIPGLWKLRAGDSSRRVTTRVTARFDEKVYAWRGYVDRAEVSIDEQTRTIDVIVRVPNPFSAGVPVDGTRRIGSTPPLLVGKFVEVEIRGLAPQSYFLMPRPALQTGNEVWTVREDKKVSIVPVRVLQRVNDEVFVIGDLEDGQLVIVGGVPFVTEGMVVQTGTTLAR